MRQGLPRRGALPPLDERFDFRGGTPSERQTLKPAQYEVLDRNSDQERSLKLWRKTGTAVDADLRQLWLHEMRQIQRVMSYAGAKEVVVDILEFVEDEHDFGVLLEHAGQTLSEKVARVHRQHWLRNVVAPRPRAILWRNARRLAQALGIIHSQGLVHGRLSAGAVMTEGAEEPDFQLTGFEWSLWLSGEDGVRALASLGPQGTGMRDGQYSFEGDWRDLGRLISSCLGMTVTRSGDLNPTNPAQPGVHLGTSQVAVIRKLMAPRRSENLDAATIMRAIDEAAVEAARGAGSSSGTLVLCFGQNAGLGEAVFDCSAGGIAIDEYGPQLDWVRADLDGGARLLTPRDFDPARDRLRLVTANMVYSLAALQQEGVAAWDVAICRKAERRAHDFAIGDGGEAEVEQPIEVASSARRAAEARSRLGPDALDWSGLSQPTATNATHDRGAVVRLALTLVQVVEAVVRALDVYPVEVVATRTEGGSRYAALAAQPNSERDRYAARVGVPETARTLKRLFEDDQRDADAKWRLSRSAGLGASRRGDVAASFHDVRDHAGRRAYWFELDDELTDERAWFLKVERDAGTEGQIQRRLRAIKALGDRVDLAQVLDDPWRARRSGRDGFDEHQRADDRFKALDVPKQKALVGLWETMPTYLVVGPPGVGKTHLVTEVVRRRFETDGSSRLLLTAQGHDALDHLQAKACKVLEEAGRSDLIVVRSSAPGRAATAQDVGGTRSRILRNLSESALMEDAPVQIRDRVRELANLAAGNAASGQGMAKDEGAGLNAASSLILDAANVVISTANSGDVARLVEAREQFDWVIVEEAAKATGPELVGPLMLSGRRLMIGDHRQLPPFDADRLRGILGNHALVAEAVALADRYVGPLIREGEIAELEELAEDQVGLRAVADAALRLLEPFRSFVTEDERRGDLNPSHHAISSTLTEQRRMDPAIAEIVSAAFYDGKLGTTPERVAESHLPGPVASLAPLPGSPVVVVDFAHVSSSGSAARAERERPRFHNPGEALATLDVLRLIRARPEAGGSPSLAVLSFYKAQVDKLGEGIEAGMIDGSLSHLSGFVPAARGKWVSTVDGFQGNEADVVIVSLVRNNPGAGASALGFLRDRRRMNVALSRAKSKLVIVGSLAFLREAVRGVNPEMVDAHELSFLLKVDETIARLGRSSRSNGTPAARIVTHLEIRPAGRTC